eukprot:GFUD01069369.1.p1 GENE.GFUD01069369.1~~GFUD01069369.1.p1  ORF type:complete len:581 (-),score=152.76 GFUD01069369.1:125-1867(-)
MNVNSVTNILDLAASSHQLSILQSLVHHGLLHHKEMFEQFLARTVFTHPGEIFTEIVKEDRKVAQDILDSFVDIENEENEEPFLKIDLRAFRTQNAVETLLVNGHKDIFYHPVVEAYMVMKWHKTRPIFYSFLAWNILSAVILSLLVIADQNHHQTVETAVTNYSITILLVLSIMLYVPILVTEVTSAVQTHRKLLSKKKIVLQSLYLLLFLFLISTRPYTEHCSYNTTVRKLHQHIAAWTVLTAWLKIFILSQDIPAITIYFQMFISVFCEILKFITAVLSVLIGFSLSFHVILPYNKQDGERFSSPINSFLKILCMMTGELSFDTTFSELILEVEGTTQIIFLLFFLTTNIVMINIMIGLTITNIQETVKIKEQLILVRMSLLTCLMEKLVFMVQNVGRRCKIGIGNWYKFLEEFVDSQIYFKLNESFKNKSMMYTVTNKNTEHVNVLTKDLLPTNYTLPRHIYDTCMAIVADRIELEAAMAEAEQAAGDGEDYTSLYGDDQYEEIQGESKYGLWDFKESLMKELKRDLCKLMRVEKTFSSVKKKPKSVNVRPGLALGVITLQAGARGLTPPLHLGGT